MVPRNPLYDDGMSRVKGKIKPGDKVVAEGQIRLVQGTTVVIKKRAVGEPANDQAAGAQ